MDRQFRRLQLLSAALHTLAHATNEAQKKMGIITLLWAWVLTIPASALISWLAFLLIGQIVPQQ